jgi:hypothetical protein
MGFAVVAAVTVTAALWIFKPTRFTELLVMGINIITTVVVTIIALGITAFTLIKERRKERQKFDETAEFKVYEERKFKAKVLMLRLVVALTFATFIFWVPYGIFQLYLLITFEKLNRNEIYIMPEFFQWIYHFYVASVPARGFIHYAAIWIALKSHSSKVKHVAKKEANQPSVEEMSASSDTFIKNPNPSIQFNPVKQASDTMVSQEQKDDYRPCITLGSDSAFDANGMSASTAEKGNSIDITIARESSPLVFDSLQRTGSISMPKPIGTSPFQRPVTHDSLDLYLHKI